MPFELLLPQNLPSSYDGGVGHVRYTARCKIKISHGSDKETSRHFSVCAVTDLNAMPEVQVRAGSDVRCVSTRY